MDVVQKSTLRKSIRRGGFTLPELVIATAIAAISLGGVIYGYVLSAQSAEWSAYNLAGNALALQRMEQTRAAKWDRRASPPVDELVATNFPIAVEILDIPITKTNIAYATNVTTISTVSASPPVRMVRVDCSWRFTSGAVFTNTLVTYRAPDQ
jgi:prepilin-type N-terminal cleavage/methylation domain-containing protein